VNWLLRSLLTVILVPGPACAEDVAAVFAALPDERADQRYMGEICMRATRAVRVHHCDSRINPMR
jgi:hypothetical protein